MSRPQYLKEGDRVAIAAPARKITPDELLPAVKLLESWGLEVELPEHLYDSDNQFAGSYKSCWTTPRCAPYSAPAEGTAR